MQTSGARSQLFLVLALGAAACSSAARQPAPLPPSAGDGGSVMPSDGGTGCTSTSYTAMTVSRPVDVILFVDTSPSMGDAVAAVRQNINVNLAGILQTSGIDYRVILLAAYPGLCVDPPLGGAACSSKPPAPALTARFFQYSIFLGSGNGLTQPLATYNTADSFDLAPNGWSQWLRPDSIKVIIQLSDTKSKSDISGDEFDTRLLALAPSRFGSAMKREYTYHGLIGVPDNNPVTKPWAATDPLQKNGCHTGNLQAEAQDAYQRVAILSGGLRYPLCEASHYDVIFQQVSAGAIAQASVPCTFAVPTAPVGQTIDEDTIVARYTPGSGAPATWSQVKDATHCDATSFYIVSHEIVLCPDACTVATADPAAKIDVEAGCGTIIQ